MKRLLFAVTFLVSPLFAVAQTADWEQRVQYDMDIHVHAERNQFEGTQRVVYTNNSPDTLRTVYYHLYFNAFQPTSMMAERNRALPDADGRVVPRIFELKDDEVGYHRVRSLQQNGQTLDFEVNDTVLRARLAEPILPGASTTFMMTFESQVPLQTRRSGRDNREGVRLSMSQWYPKIAGYDLRGWHPDPYIGREFYAPFGTFDVRLTLPADYVVGATGVLQNADAVGHGYAPGNGTPTNGDLTWHFRAENVHDFAWAADPDFVHDAVPGPDGLTVHLLYQPDVADRWQPMKQWVPAIFAYFNEHFGDYPYEQFTVAQAGDGGMEYPQIIFITGRRSPASLFGVTAHEIGHEWYYGFLANNEADYAWMDEGFTSYIDGEVTAALQGRETLHTGAYLGYLFAKEQGYYERPNTPADWFATNRAYGVTAYTFGEMLVAMLGYVIGDEQRDAWLKRYYDTFRFRHPDPLDLEKLAEDVSGLHLDWYFEQFTNTTRDLDYAVDDVRSVPADGGWRTTVELERLEAMVMPQDVKLTLADGSEQWVNIPLLIMQGHKPVPADWTVAAPWPWTSDEYELTIDTPSRVVAVELDPLGRTPDKNRLNNASSFPLDVAFLHPPRPDWWTYSVGVTPVLSYYHEWGFGGGLQARGEYLFGRHPLKADVTVWPGAFDTEGNAVSHSSGGLLNVGEWHDAIDYQLRYANNLERFGPTARFGMDLRKRLGIMDNRLWFESELGALPALEATEKRFYVELGHQKRLSDRAYNGFAPFGPRVDLWNDDHVLTARIGLDVQDGNDRVGLFLQAGGTINSAPFDPSSSFWDPMSAQDRANLLGFDAVKTTALGRFTGRAAMSARLAYERLVGQQRYALGAAPLETQWRNDAFRSASSSFDHPLHDLHLTAFSGVGPVAYLLGEGSFGGYWSNMVAGSLSLSTGPLTQRGLPAALSLEAFSGAGFVFDARRDMDGDELVADAGLGAALDVPRLLGAVFGDADRWTGQSDILDGLVIEAKFPFWVSDPDRFADRGLIQVDDQDALAFRWLIGVRTGL